MAVLLAGLERGDEASAHGRGRRSRCAAPRRRPWFRRRRPGARWSPRRRARRSGLFRGRAWRSSASDVIAGRELAVRRSVGRRFELRMRWRTARRKRHNHEELHVKSCYHPATARRLLGSRCLNPPTKDASKRHADRHHRFPVHRAAGLGRPCEGCPPPVRLRRPRPRSCPPSMSSINVQKFYAGIEHVTAQFQQTVHISTFGSDKTSGGSGVDREARQDALGLPREEGHHGQRQEELHLERHQRCTSSSTTTSRS